MCIHQAPLSPRVGAFSIFYSVTMTVALSRRFSAFVALALLQCVAAVPSVGGRWRLVQEGWVIHRHSDCDAWLIIDASPAIIRTTGVSGMQLAVVSETKAIIFDKVYVFYMNR